MPPGRKINILMRNWKINLHLERILNRKIIFRKVSELWTNIEQSGFINRNFCRSSKSISSLQARGKELKRFMWYSLYGWGFPLLLTVVPLLFYHIQVLPDSIQIFINEKKCFVHRGMDIFKTVHNFKTMFI